MKYFSAYLGSSVKTIIASHLQYKHSGTFANRNPQKSEKCDPVVVTLLKMQPHYSQSSHENGTPSSGTSPLASYKEVPLPPRDKGQDHLLRLPGYFIGETGRNLSMRLTNTNERRQMMTSIITLPRTIYRRNIKSIETLRHVLRILQSTINDSL